MSGDIQKMMQLKKELGNIHRQIVQANLVKNWSLARLLEERQKTLESELAYHYKDFPSYTSETN